MGRTKVTGELAANWVRRHQRGESFRSIGREHKVDPRTIQIWVQKLTQEKEKEHWEMVSRQVDSKYLDEHHRLLLRVAIALLNATHADPVVNHDSDAEHLLANSMTSVSRQTVEILKGRGINLDPEWGDAMGSTRLRDEAVTRLSWKLLDALMQHEPQLEKAVNQWKGCWAGFQQAHLKLAEMVRNLFKQRQMPDNIAENLKWPTVGEALEGELPGGSSCASRLVLLDGERAKIVRYCPDFERPLCQGSREDMKAAKESYDKVLPQARHKERIGPVVNAYNDLQRAVRRVEDLVDRLVLMGKPQGQCTLCPSYSIAPSTRSKSKTAL